MCRPIAAPEEEDGFGEFLASMFSDSGAPANGGTNSPAPLSTAPTNSQSPVSTTGSSTGGSGSNAGAGPNSVDDSGQGPVTTTVSSGAQPMSRKAQLVKKFVTDHQDEKDRFDSSSLDDALVVQGSKLKDPMSRTGLDTATDVVKSIGLLPDAAGKVTGFDGVIGDKDTSNTTNSALGIASSGIGAITSTMSLFSNAAKARRTKNADKKNAANTRAFASGLDLIANLAGVTSAGGNIGLFGEKNLATELNSTAQQAAGGLDLVSGALTFSSSILKFLGDKSDVDAHKNIAERAKRWYDNPQMKQTLKQKRNDASRNIKGMKQLIPPNLMQSADDNGNGKMMKDLRTSRHTAKARLYAMKQAAMMHKNEYDNKGTNIFGNLFTGIGSVGTMLKGINKFALGNQVEKLSLAGQVLSSVGTFGKLLSIGKSFYNASDYKKNKTEEARENVKRIVVDEYLNKKAAKIKRAANEWAPSVQEQANLQRTDNDDPTNLGNDTISDEEAKRLVFLRLGIQVTRNSEVNDDAHYKTAFKRITEKRANNIMNSDPNQKKGMLTALGLDEHATFDEVYTALCGGTV